MRDKIAKERRDRTCSQLNQPLLGRITQRAYTAHAQDQKKDGTMGLECVNKKLR